MALSSQVTDTAVVLEILVLMFKEQMCVSDACIFKFLFIIRKKKNKTHKKTTNQNSPHLHAIFQRAQWEHCYVICIEVVQIKCCAFSYF